ncbi:CGNR zinc finger domain-containing protein [Micromonospora zhanjiangensis]|uniref:CGNR zinc finger domain-containing protein n=1 Tax=Micromonospora zhanjiangensis TaxID=1522057 RepID=A0ABV8KEK4_9ACTN
MLFAHDTECALTAAAALVNTAPDPAGDDEELPDVAALAEFMVIHRYTGRHERTETELAAVRALRPRLRTIWESDEDTIVEIVNGLLREHAALPQLIRHDDEPYHVHAVPLDAPLATRMAVEFAMALADLVRGGELSRLRTCERPDCRNVLVDLSKNRSKRFCGTVCGNRAAVAAYRARKSADPV